jgi:hypothetical protein
MPVTVQRRGNKFAIVEKATGKVKGHSDTEEKAQASANAINASLHGWKPTGNPAKYKRKLGRL